MTSRNKMRALAVLTIVLVALVVLSSGLSQSQFRPVTLGSYQPTTGSGSPFGVPTLGRVWRSIGILILLPVGVLFVVVLVRSSQTRRELVKRVMTAVFLLIVFYGLLTLVQRLPKRVTDQAVAAAPASTVVAPPAVKPVPAVPLLNDFPRWFVGAVGGIVIVAILAAMWLVVRQQNTPEEAEQPPDVALVANEARGALAQLQAGENVRDVVLRCYLEMSRVLGECQAIRREQAMTPREFEQRLVATGIRDEHIRRLTQLFERIRYGVKVADRRDEDEAQACLTAIIDAYGRSG